jgi:hypothetical protein
MVKGTAWPLLGPHSDCRCKQPSVQMTTKQVGVGRVAPVDSSGSWKRKLDPNWRVEEVVWLEAIHTMFLNPS